MTLGFKNVSKYLVDRTEDLFVSENVKQNVNIGYRTGTYKLRDGRMDRCLDRFLNIFMKLSLISYIKQR